jgi:uncharacterized protein (TIGR00299 family) protein
LDHVHFSPGESRGASAQHLHLDALGGAAGDMFVAALLHAFPEHEHAAVQAATMISGAGCRLVGHRDHVLAGARFLVQEHHHGHAHDHSHTSWRDIRARLSGSSLPQDVQRHAIAIFGVLAEAEGRVHGVAAEEATFHEVGSADSLADIVAASVIIAAMGDARWSVSALPLGGGRVKTQHGLMPVPAPATTLLLEGFDVIDDGIAGERVTPTGAAILRHLCHGSRAGLHARVGRTGVGFGTKTLPGISNVLRVLAFDSAASEAQRAPAHRELAVIGFEVDDQSGEDLACGLDRVRMLPGVHDVIQAPVFGKKSRIAVHVQVLVRPDVLEDAIEACFRETTTIGLRTHLVQGRALQREMLELEVDGRPVRVKRVERPGGATAKAEADDASDRGSHAARTRLRREAERRAGLEHA